MMDGRFWVGLVASGAIAFCMVQGCTSDHDTRVFPDPEGGAPSEGGSGDTGKGATCPSDVPVDKKLLEWKPPAAPQQGQCQDDDVAAMKTYLATNPAATNEDFENFVKNRDKFCHDCIFGDADGQLWPPAPVRANKVVTFNVGACFAITTGSQPCGQAVQNAWDCGFEACSLCTSPDALATCRTKARTGACAAYEDKARVDCGGSTAADEICGGPFDSIRIQCITTVSPLADAGTD
jgi:hypothetical protein